MMRHHFIPLLSGIWILVSPISHAIVDTNENGVSDLWEKQYNSDDLYATFDPQADPDGDGWTNAQEASAGTNPFDSNPPVGFIRPEIIESPVVLGDLNNDGIDEVVTPAALTVTWPSQIGKQYTLKYSPDLSENSWQNVEDPFLGDGSVVEFHFLLGTTERLFWRVSVDDADTDGDQLSNAEENQFGSNPWQADADNDGVNDFGEYLEGTNPQIPRIWGFREVPNSDGTVTYTWNSYAANESWFHLERLQPDNSWKILYSTTYGSAALPFVEGIISYSLTLNPATDYLP